MYQIFTSHNVLENIAAICLFQIIVILLFNFFLHRLELKALRIPETQIGQFGLEQQEKEEIRKLHEGFIVQ